MSTGLLFLSKNILDSLIFKGWRNEIFGEKIKDFLKGKLKIIKKNKKLVLDKN